MFSFDFPNCKLVLLLPFYINIISTVVLFGDLKIVFNLYLRHVYINIPKPN